MAEKIIVVANRKSAATKTGSDYLIVTDTTGRVWNVFDKLCHVFLVDRGAVIKIETVKDSKFENITKAEYLMTIPLPEIDSADMLKSRSQCLSYAKDLAVAGKIDIENIPAQAQLFYEWVTGDKTNA
jgi:hypothetical protein